MNFRRGKRLLLVCCTVFALAVLPAFVLAQNIDTTGQFELDGNATSNDAAAPYGPAPDWQYLSTFTPPAVPGGFVAWTGILNGCPIVNGSPNCSASLPFTFTGGGSKDIYDIPSWQFNTGTAPAKDTIEHGYAAGFKDSGNHLIFVFGLDTFATNGSRQVGVWFFKNAVAPTGACKSNGTCHFTGTHADGDVLLQSNFSIGGSVSTVTVYEWQSGTLVQKFTGAAACESGSATEACAISNTQNVPLYWSYVPKSAATAPFGECSNTTNCAPPVSFFEGGIDITAVLGASSECFTRFQAETRSSTSFDSELETFVNGSFNLCSDLVGKACPGAQAAVDLATNKFIYHFGGIVYNNGGGDLDITAVDTFPSDASSVSPAGTAAGNVHSYDLGTVPGGTCQTWPTPTAGGITCPIDSSASGLHNASGAYATGTFESSFTSPSNAVEADGAIPGQTTVVAKATDQANCPPPPGGGISASKGCTISVNPSNLSVTVSFNGTVINNSPYPLTNLSATDVQITPTGTANGGTVTFGATSLGACDVAGGCTSCPATDPLTGKAPTYCTTYSGTYNPSAASSGTNACDITFNDRVTVTSTVPDLAGTTGVTSCTYVNGACEFNTQQTVNPVCHLCPCGGVSP